MALRELLARKLVVPAANAALRWASAAGAAPPAPSPAAAGSRLVASRQSKQGGDCSIREAYEEMESDRAAIRKDMEECNREFERDCAEIHRLIDNLPWYVAGFSGAAIVVSTFVLAHVGAFDRSTGNTQKLNHQEHSV